MEVAKLKEFFLKPARPFTKKREVDWKKLKVFLVSVIGLIVFGIVLWPSPKTEVASFHEKLDTNQRPLEVENDPTQETLKQLQTAKVNTRNVPRSLDHLYAPSPSSSSSGGGGGGDKRDRNSSMIIGRGGSDAKNQLTAGTRILVRLPEKLHVTNQAMPITAFVVNDVTSENSVAITQGAKLIGDVSFDEGSERAQMNWRSVIFPDGKERPLSGLGLGFDGQLGVEGRVKSDAVKNAVGQPLTRFIGAYAEGSISHGQFGASEGGKDNGLKYAVAQTAKDRANAFGEGLQKEKKWMELEMGTEFFIVLNAPFIFRDPGATYGK